MAIRSSQEVVELEVSNTSKIRSSQVVVELQYGGASKIHSSQMAVELMVSTVIAKVYPIVFVVT